MTKTSKTIVFFGSGPVAAESLRLLAEDFAVEAVITKPRPIHHRGDYPVLDIAAKLGLKVITVSSKTELSQFFETSQLQSQLGVVIDFGIIIDQAVIDYFPLGIVNSHFSLLPRWRGADPISFTILNGDDQTGVSLMLINNKLDEGPLLAQSSFDLSDDITTPQLTHSLIELSHEMLKQVLPLHFEEQVKPFEQSSLDEIPSYSRKLTKADSILDFMKPAEQLEREVRAFAGWPRSRTTLGDINIVVTKAHVETGQGTPGNLETKPKQLGIYTSKGILVIDQVIPAGKKEMPIAAFLAGYKI